MTTQSEIEKHILDAFRFLPERLHYSEPMIARSGDSTRLDYTKGDIGIEIELDWREHEVFLLAVRLDHNRLPAGYYTAQGRVCRKHLANIARERRWLPERLDPVPASKTDPMITSALGHKGALLAYIDVLEQDWDSLW